MTNIKRVRFILSSVEPIFVRTSNTVDKNFNIDMDEARKEDFLLLATLLAEEFWEQMQKGKLK